MKKVYFIAAIFLFILATCSLVNFINRIPNEKVRVASLVRSQAAKNIKQKLGLTPFGVGGQMMNKIQKLMLDFQYKNDITIEEGRRFLVQAVFEFLNEINSNEMIRKHLHNYPFQPKNVEIFIFLEKPDGSNFETNDLEVLVARDGKVEYKFNNSSLSGYRTQEETFEEACRIVEEENQRAG